MPQAHPNPHGPRRFVTAVYRKGGKLSAYDFKYVLELECGHRLGRYLLRQCDYVACHRCGANGWTRRSAVDVRQIVVAEREARGEN